MWSHPDIQGLWSSFLLVLDFLNREVIQLNLALELLSIAQEVVLQLRTIRNLPNRPPNKHTHTH